MKDVKIGVNLDCSDHALVEFAVLRDMNQSRNIVKTLNFRKPEVHLFGELVNRAAWEMVLKDNRAEWSLQILKNLFHRMQELSIPRCFELLSEEEVFPRLRLAFTLLFTVSKPSSLFLHYLFPNWLYCQILFQMLNTSWSVSKPNHWESCTSVTLNYYSAPGFFLSLFI